MKLLLIIILILKIIGIVLLAVLGVALALILVVLFARLRYNIKISYKGKLDIDIRAKYLFGLAKIRYIYKDDEADFDFGFPFKSKILKEEIEDTPNKVKKEAEKVADTEEDIEKKTETDTVYATSVKNEKSNAEQNIKSKSKAKNKKPKKAKNKTKKEKSIWDNINYWKEEYIKYQGTEVIKLVYRLVIDILKALKPKRFLCEAVIGFDDPSITGVTIGGISVINAFVPLDINVAGDFEKECFECNAGAVGGTCVFSIGLPIVKFIFKKPIWKLIKQYLRGE